MLRSTPLFFFLALFAYLAIAMEETEGEKAAPQPLIDPSLFGMPKEILLHVCIDDTPKEFLKGAASLACVCKFFAASLSGEELVKSFVKRFSAEGRITRLGENLLHLLARHQKYEILNLAISKFKEKNATKAFLQDNFRREMPFLTLLRYCYRRDNNDEFNRAFSSMLDKKIRPPRNHASYERMLLKGNFSSNLLDAQLEQIETNFGPYPYVCQNVSPAPISNFFFGATVGSIEYLRLAQLKENFSRPQEALKHYGVLADTPFHAAALNGHIEVLEELTNTAPDGLEHTNHYGETPLISAAQGGSVSCITLLLTAGANTKTKCKNSYTAMMHAAMAGRLEAVKLLFDADPEITVSKSLIKVLAEADRRGFEDVVNFLLEKLNLKGEIANALNQKNCCPMIWATEMSSGALIAKLKDLGFDIEQKDEANGSTALLFAAQDANLPCVETLLKLNAQVKAKNNSNGTAFYFTCVKAPTGATNKKNAVDRDRDVAEQIATLLATAAKQAGIINDDKDFMTESYNYMVEANFYDGAAILVEAGVPLPLKTEKDWRVMAALRKRNPELAKQIFNNAPNEAKNPD